ncbi:MAG: hypothetical protein ACJA2M_002320 [Polaribacter sp.]|jgi:hypothetical protein|tara:strand:- start:468 stop:728 length:261 start_codon:yes stop_codon:yes gene_type:complete
MNNLSFFIPDITKGIIKDIVATILTKSELLKNVVNIANKLHSINITLYTVFIFIIKGKIIKQIDPKITIPLLKSSIVNNLRHTPNK